MGAYCVGTEIKWWNIIWQGVGSAIAMWAKVISNNPWPWMGILGLVLLGWLLAARRRRRRS